MEATLTVLHERLALPVVIPASTLLPHTRVVGLRVLVFDPSRGGGDGDYVENNGEQHQQGYDPPASRVGDPTAKHDGRSECVERGTAGWSVRSIRADIYSGVWCVFTQKVGTDNVPHPGAQWNLFRDLNGWARLVVIKAEAS